MPRASHRNDRDTLTTRWESDTVSSTLIRILRVVQGRKARGHFERWAVTLFVLSCVHQDYLIESKGALTEKFGRSYGETTYRIFRAMSCLWVVVVLLSSM